MTSYKNATRAMCKSCIHDPTQPGNWVEQVVMCTVLDCPLWKIRPKIDGRSKRSREKVVRLMTESRVDHDTIRRCLGETKPEKGPPLNGVEDVGDGR